MESLLLPFNWFLELLDVIVSWEVIPNVTFGSISLAILSIICLFRFIVFPLIGGSVASVLGEHKARNKKEHK